jgi:hypothetical protein
VIGREIEEVERGGDGPDRHGGVSLGAGRCGGIVHPGNPVNQVSFDDLREVLTGANTSWGVRRPDRAPFRDRGSTQSLTQYVARQILERDDIVTVAVLAENDSAVIAAVARTPDAGFRFAVESSSGREGAGRVPSQGLPYVELTPTSTATLPAHSLVQPGHPRSGREARWVITFALSEPGQRLVRDGHRVPASVPVRFTRRLPTASSH